MSLVSQLNSLTVRIATEFKSIRSLTGSLTGLATTDKSSLVAAINEALAAAGSGGSIDADSITDATTLGKALIRASSASDARTDLDVYSKAEADAAATSAAASVVDGAPGALDTLNELAAALGDDANFASTTSTALGNRVRVDAVQAFSAGQKQQARDNIDVYSKTEVGDPTTDFVATFEAGLV